MSRNLPYPQKLLVTQLNAERDFFTRITVSKLLVIFWLPFLFALVQVYLYLSGCFKHVLDNQKHKFFLTFQEKHKITKIRLTISRIFLTIKSTNTLLFFMRPVKHKSDQCNICSASGNSSVPSQNRLHGFEQTIKVIAEASGRVA